MQSTFSLIVAIALLSPFFPIITYYVFIERTIFTPVLLYSIFDIPVKFFYVVGYLWSSDDLFSPLSSLVLSMHIASNVLVCFWALVYYKLILNFKFRSIKQLPHYVSNKSLLKPALLFLAFSTVTFTLLATYSFGLFNWISDPRTGYLHHRSGAGHFYALTISFLSVFFVFSFFGTRRLTFRLLHLSICLYFASLLGSKQFVLSFGLSFLILVWFQDRRLALRLSLFVIPLFFIFLVGLFFGGRAFNLIEIITYFDYFHNAEMYYRDYLDGKIELFAGEIFISNFWSYVPRFLFENKPYIYGPVLIADLYYPGAAEAGAYPAFGAGVLWFADFGFLGLMFMPAFSSLSYTLGIIFYLTKRVRIAGPNTYFPHLILIILCVAPQFGLYFSGALWVGLTIFVVWTSNFTRRLSIKLNHVLD